MGQHVLGQMGVAAFIEDDILCNKIVILIEVRIRVSIQDYQVNMEMNDRTWLHVSVNNVHAVDVVQGRRDAGDVECHIFLFKDSLLTKIVS